LSFQHCWSQEELLTCVEAEAKLPIPSGLHNSFYDGKDTIYIFGGRGSTPDDLLNTIYSYDINLDTISLVATFPEGTRKGMVTFHNKSIYYLGGYGQTGESDRIYKFDPESKTVSLVGHLESAKYDGVAMKYNESSNTVQILALGRLQSPGYPNKLECLNLTSLTSCGQTFLNINYGNENGVRALVANGYAYIFAQDSPSSGIEKLDLSTLESELTWEDFPELFFPPSVVFDGKYGYIIGGHRDEDIGVPNSGIFRYDPETEEHQFLPVANFPATGSQLYSYPSAEYVEKLNRIYLFGGYVYFGNEGYRDGIWYIDLNSTTTV